MAKRNRKEARAKTEAAEAEAGGGQSESMGEMPATDTPPDPKPTEPEWKARVDRERAKECESFEIVPGTWFDRQTPRIFNITRRELTRRGHNPQRLLSVGVIRMVESKADADPESDG